MEIDYNDIVKNRTQIILDETLPIEVLRNTADSLLTSRQLDSKFASQGYIYSKEHVISLIDTYGELHLRRAKYENSRHQLYVVSSNLFRGYICPSPLEDIITPNMKRGRLTACKPSRGSYYTYCFDENGFPVFIKNSATDYCEYLYHEKDVVKGIYCNSTKTDMYYTECRYENGKIASLSQINFIFGAGRMFTTKKQYFTYSDNKLKTVRNYIFNSNTPLISGQKYIFSFNKRGIFSQCRMKELYWTDLPAEDAEIAILQKRDASLFCSKVTYDLLMQRL